MAAKEGERLGTRPFVLEGAEEIDDLAAPTRSAWAGPRAIAPPTVEALLDEALEGPAHLQYPANCRVVDVVIALAVRGADLRRVDVFEPVVGDLAPPSSGSGHRAKISLIRVGVHPPIWAIGTPARLHDGVDVVAG